MKKRLLEDLKEAMKEKNEIKKNAIQMTRAGILQIEKDKGIELTDEQIVELIAKEVKKRKDSIADYEKGGREDLVNQIKEEISYLEVYLPKQLTKEEIAKACELCVEAKADLVKTSTGFVKGGVGAKPEDVKIMHDIVAPHGMEVKASGGVRSKADAIAVIEAGATRIGTSSGIKIVSEE